MTLDELNHLPPEAAARIFRNCCAAEPWVAGMVAGRPYRDLTEVLACSRALWPTLDESDWLQAFEATRASVMSTACGRNTPAPKTWPAPSKPAPAKRTRPCCGA